MCTSKFEYERRNTGDVVRFEDSRTPQEAVIPRDCSEARLFHDSIHRNKPRTRICNFVMAKRKHAEMVSEATSSRSRDGGDSTYGTQSPAVAECPFTIEYTNQPGQTSKAKERKRAKKTDDKTAEKEEHNLPGTDLEIKYIIRPGKLWESMKKYRNFVGELSACAIGVYWTGAYNRSGR